MATTGPYERAAQRLLTKADETLLEKMLYKQPPPAGKRNYSDLSSFGRPTPKLRRRHARHAGKLRRRG
jgi:hypothetical protein